VSDQGQTQGEEHECYRCGSSETPTDDNGQRPQPRKRDALTAQQRTTWQTAEPKPGPFHVLWAAEQETRSILVVADLSTELRHLKTMLQHGFTEEQIVRYWLWCLKHDGKWALPRYMHSRIGTYYARRNIGDVTTADGLADTADVISEQMRRLGYHGEE